MARKKATEKEKLSSEETAAENEVIPQESNSEEGGESPPQSSEVENVTPESLASEIGGLPEPNEMAIEAYKAANSANDQTSANTIKGEQMEFDPIIHATDTYGNPIPTKAGGFRRKPGRKSKRLESAKIERDKTQEEIAKLEAEKLDGQIKASAFAATQVTNFGLTTILAIKPSDKENQNLFDSYEEYYKFAGPSKMPPWMAPVLVTCSIIQQHIHEEEPKTRLDKIKEWVGIRVSRLRRAKHKNEDSNK